jgi:hypothetical protein
VSWPDPVVEARGHKPGSPYVEFVWLGVLGPSTTLCWSRISRIATAQPNTEVDTTDLATSLGLGAQLGHNAAITRTLSRMVMFGAAARIDDTLAVRRALPDVPDRTVARLSHTARVAHQRWAHHQSPAPGIVRPDISASLDVSL